MTTLLNSDSSSVPAESTWKSFHVDSLKARLLESDRPYLPFLDEPSMSAGIYRLPAGATDEQNPHRLDEVYYILEGKCRFEAGGEHFEVRAGQSIFVKAEVDHRFYDIEEDLLTYVVFSKAPSHPDDEDAAAIDWEALHRQETGTGQFWNPFFNYHTLEFGLSVLPEGDDSPPLVHDQDELSLIVSGKGEIRVDGHSMDITPGAIFFAGKKTKHEFINASKDLEILTLREK